MSTFSSSKTIAFLGASGGCGLSSLKNAIADGHTCIALCRTPAKLETLFPEKPANLHIQQGNAHDPDAVAACLTNPANPAYLVDKVSFTVGGAFDAKKFIIDDPDVCKKEEVGYAISREDVGRWMYENLLCAENPQLECKAVSSTW